MSAQARPGWRDGGVIGVILTWITPKPTSPGGRPAGPVYGPGPYIGNLAMLVSMTRIEFWEPAGTFDVPAELPRDPLAAGELQVRWREGAARSAAGDQGI